jgi:hypothetical protein
MERPTIPFLINIYCLQKLLPIKPYQKPFKSKTLFFSMLLKSSILKAYNFIQEGASWSMRSKKVHTALPFLYAPFLSYAFKILQGF